MMVMVDFKALLLVVIGVANSDAFLPYYPVIPASNYGPRVFSPYPLMSGLLKTTKEKEKEEEEVTPNPLLERAIYQGRGIWDCNELELLINKAELSTSEIPATSGH